MKRNAFIAGILYLLIPGPGQIYAKKSKRDAIILIKQAPYKANTVQSIPK
jgi:hypothetical protein